jgi:hypothetical protein
MKNKVLYEIHELHSSNVRETPNFTAFCHWNAVRSGYFPVTSENLRR